MQNSNDIYYLPLVEPTPKSQVGGGLRANLFGRTMCVRIPTVCGIFAGENERSRPCYASAFGRGPHLQIASNLLESRDRNVCL
jgi:hypothetical protein